MSDPYLQAIRDGKQLVAHGAAKYGKVRIVPSSGSHFAHQYSPHRTWDEEKQNHRVYEKSLGPISPDEVREQIRQWLDHDEIEVEIQDHGVTA